MEKKRKGKNCIFEWVGLPNYHEEEEEGKIAFLNG